jgi:hypothetical protein
MKGTLMLRKLIIILVVTISIIIMILSLHEPRLGTQENPFTYKNERSVGEVRDGQIYISRIFWSGFQSESLSYNLSDDVQVGTIVIVTQCYNDKCNYKLSDFQIISLNDGITYPAIAEDLNENIDQSNFLYFVLPRNFLAEDHLFTYTIDSENRYFFTLR